MNDPHRTLDLPYDATPEQIRERYRQLVRIFHPDRYRKDGDRAYAEAKLKEINEAYEALLNRSHLDLSRQTRLPEPVFSPETIDFGTVAFGDIAQRRVQVGNRGAQADSLQIHLGDGQSWFSIVKGQRLNASQPLPLNLELQADTATLAPDQQYESWIEVDMDGRRARLPLLIHVTPTKTRASAPSPWIPIILILLLGGGMLLGTHYLRTVSTQTSPPTAATARGSASEAGAATVNEPAVVTLATDAGANAPGAQEPAVSPVSATVSVAVSVAVLAATATPTDVPAPALPVAATQNTATTIPTTAADSAATPLPSATPIPATPTDQPAVSPAVSPTVTSTSTPPPSPTPTATAPPAAAPPVAAPPAVTDVTVRVPDAYEVNARSDTSVDSPSLGLLAKGTTYVAVARTIDNAWVRISLPDGREAWVFRESVEADLTAVETLPVVYTSLQTEAPAAVPQQADAVEDGAVIPDATAPETTDAPAAEAVVESAPSTVADDAAQIHLVQPGDFLKQLAVQYYGDEALWTLIYDTNAADIGPDPDLLPAGLELVIPPAP